MKKKLRFALIFFLALLSGCASKKMPENLDEVNALIPLEIAVDGKSSNELLALGKSYEAGDGVVQFYAKAEAYYEKALEVALSDSEKSAAKEALLSLKTKKENILTASPNGQGELFMFFRKGVTAGQAGEFEKAWAICYDTAFFFGDVKGLESLADFLRDGSGITEDVSKAIAIYEYCAKVLKNGKGYSALGKIYEAEDGTYPSVKHSMDKALEYFRLSFESKDIKSADFKGPRYIADYLDSGYEKDDGTLASPDYAQAEKYYLLAADSAGSTFDGTSCYKLGVYYEEGREGVSQDFSKAATYYEKAVSDPNTHATMLGIPQSYYSLGKLYENGLGVEKNLDKAKAYYEKALSAAEETLSYEFAAGREAAKVTKKQAEEALERF